MLRIRIRTLFCLILIHICNNPHWSGSKVYWLPYNSVQYCICCTNIWKTLFDIKARGPSSSSKCLEPNIVDFPVVLVHVWYTYILENCQLVAQPCTWTWLRWVITWFCPCATTYLSLTLSYSLSLALGYHLTPTFNYHLSLILSYHLNLASSYHWLWPWTTTWPYLELRLDPDLELPSLTLADSCPDL